MSASSLSLPIFLRINFLISYLDSNRLTEHIRLTHTESFAEWQKAGAGRTSRAFKHPGHDVTAPDVWPSILTDYTYDSELDNADGVPLAFRRSSMFPEGNRGSWWHYKDSWALLSLTRKAKTIEYPKKSHSYNFEWGEMQHSVWLLYLRKPHLLNKRANHQSVKSLHHCSCL